ncbi:dTDP-glucose 4,6-dehydratase [Botrimarina colliarenosi]|uniref:dTDP-glucose 4,6-dehydratase n=1 Tax=Botrimarina colliarenosi TaxID=2528001 RepID=A0A5C6A9Z3_9BACT|nr:dTDP-glucose 4,6-dehydratase [Botrimarina colliarenosi]TWT96177.1 dTDP-glucose 4,6-dehydratase [Botrimarina colliarenosi]
MPSTRPLQRVLVTGGAGFIGSTLLRRLLARTGTRVLNYDALTYAGLIESVVDLAADPRYAFTQGDVVDAARLAEEVARFRPDTLIHLAAESHVDRSIAEPAAFVRTNVEGTATVLRVWRDYRDRVSHEDAATADSLRLVHVSTDEVYGSLPVGEFAVEGATYNPSSPYSATKAAADHLVRSYGRTYGMPAVIVCPTNNYGPRQFPEKLIPLATLRALRGEPIPLYGDGQQVRDWLHVEDCAAGIVAAAERGRAGETYHLSATSPGETPLDEWSNQRVVQALADATDALQSGASERRALIERVADRPGHDRRYALDSSKARRELAWRPTRPLAEGLAETARWYAENQAWVAAAERRG